MAFGNSPLGILALSAAPFAREYENLRYSYVWNNLHAPPLNQRDFALSFYTYQHLNRPQTVAALLGQGTPGGAGVFDALLGLPAAAQAREAGEMAPAVAKEANRRFLPLAAALTGSGAGPVGALASLDIWSASGRTEEHLPFEVVEKELLRQVENKVADQLANANIDTLKEKLEAARKDAEKNKTNVEAALAQVAEEQIRQHQWPHGASNELHSRFDIGQDPGLRALKEGYISMRALEDRSGKHFGDVFFSQDAAGQPKLFTPTKLEKGFDPSKGNETYLYWLTADQAPEVVPFDRAEPRVREAWYREKARPLAAAEAERIAKEAQAAGGDPVRNLLDAAKGQPLISLDGVSRISRRPTARAELGGQYTPYVVPEDKVEYPAPDFVEKIVDLPNKGDVTIVTDLPKNTYYVVAVTQKIEPTQKEFQEAQLLPDLQRLRQREYRDGVLRNLQLQAHLYIDPENRKQLEERGRGSLGED
jgi:hypothetical protein